ncbi:unnamed protein product (macronuclear) [Paramecium tetraurelia]|uniref:BAR domain-containing protein n=1 Tax=Paramecium tetraurelia TaxID=5888 RepID=A0D4H1_PARTE|nr:uncharacterized protein GSPATT00013404001 [Paramecium tetraurelia]CAK77938.1 unnamed protein product [Paramecium tetraurelia]|eukprot:XP_001445335.1 hypothetical protein (macronuclear) [Paramecium tetraurelia strain d4-2]
MNYQKSRILSDNEIQSIYEQLQTNLKLMTECLKHNKTLMKDFGKATCDYGDKIEDLSKRTIKDMMKINTNYILKEMSGQIKIIGSQIMGTSQAIKELMNPIVEEGKVLKQSYNDYVKQINQRKKDQEEQFKKLDELKTKIGVYQTSIYPIEKQMTSQFRQLKQQEQMMIEEQKLKHMYVGQCKTDLNNFIIEENQIVDQKINQITLKCYELVSLCLDEYNKKFKDIAQVKHLMDYSMKSCDRSSKRSITPSKFSALSHCSSQNGHSQRSRSRSPSTQIQGMERFRDNNNSKQDISIAKNNQCQKENLHTKEPSRDALVSTKNQSKNLVKKNEDFNVVESELFEDFLNKNYNNNNNKSIGHSKSRSILKENFNETTGYMIKPQSKINTKQRSDSRRQISNRVTSDDDYI